MASELTYDALAQFTGTESYHNLTLAAKVLKLRCTDGVKFVADTGKAYWLVDAIASHQPQARKNPKLREHQFWTLEVDEKKHTGVLFCTDGNSDERLIQQRIPHTDFPLKAIKFYVVLGGDERSEFWCLMLPGEY